MEIAKRKAMLRESLLALPLLLITISVMTGPLFLLFYKPSVLLKSERLEEYVSITSYLTAFFLLVVVCMGRLSQYIVQEKKAFIALVFLWLILLFSSLIYPIPPVNIPFNWGFLGAILFYVSAVGVLKEYPQLQSRVLITYVIASGLTSIIYLTLIGSSLAPVSSGRYFFLGENPNSYSARMVISVVITLFLLPTVSQKFRLVSLLLLPSQLIVIYLSGSRGALLMLSIAFMIFLFASKLTISSKTLYSLLILVGLIGFVSFYGESNITEASGLERLLTLFESGDSGREHLWSQTFSIFLDNPIIGVGQSGFTYEMMSRYGENRDAHNLFLFLLASGGLIGISLFLIFYLSLFSSVIKVRTKSPMSLALFLVMLLFILKSGGILGYSLMWFVFAIARSQSQLIRYNENIDAI